MLMLTRHLTIACLTLGLSLAASAQETAAPTKPVADQNRQLATDQGPHFIVRRYPQDRDKAIAVVGQKTLTLGDLVDHIDARHYPGFKKLVATEPSFARYLQSDLVAPWVRQFADMEALRQRIEILIDPVDLEKAQAASLKASFEVYLGRVIESRRLQGRPEPSQTRVNSMLAEFQLKRGLSAELQGMLDLLEPQDYTRRQLRDFFNANPRFMGGQVTVQHLLIQHRDGGTGILLKDDGIVRANARIAEVKARLRPDGSNFADLVRQFSDDTRTAKTGGELPGVHRFDDRLPATLCRAAWSINDGECTTDVIETQYGYHFIKRLSFNQPIFILFTDDAIPSIRIVMRRAMQERLLLSSRTKTGQRLLL
ncbi:MAG: parvulin-like peptidyl-prolyl isomerase [Hyphomicrobiaceae bacterium]|jgi:parvulin-like peptidyl-prolyl isomerase